MANKFKLYVWQEFMNYEGSGLAFAIARSIKEARELVLEKTGGFAAEKKELETYEPEIFELNEPICFAVTGE
jgi:hypothetical protein